MIDLEVLMETPQLDVFHFLVFLIPGFLAVWVYRKTIKSEKKISDFEYAMFSFVWGLIIIAVFGTFAPKAITIQLFQNPYSAAISHSLLAFCSGWGAAKMRVRIKDSRK